MKALNKISQILAIVFGVGSVALFFVLPFAEIATAGAKALPVAAQLAFGSKVTTSADAVFDMAKSMHIQFIFWLAIIAVLMSIFAYRAKGLRYSSSIVALISAVYMWVIALSGKGFIDVRPLPGVTAIKHTSTVLIMAIVMLLFALFAIAYLLIDDYLEAKASKDKKTIGQRIALFFRDNKSEVKKIVWPTFHDVVKNTITVLVMCLIIGALIWAIDFGLGQLLNVVFNRQA